MANTPLNHDLAPVRYQLFIQPDLNPQRASHPFQGTQRMEFDVTHPTSSVRFHRNPNLDVSNLVMTAGDRVIGVPADRVSYDPKTQVAHVDLGERIPAGRATLTVDYHGRLNPKPAGVYFSEHTLPDGSKSVMMTSQMEPTDARALPCVDEPNAKAVWDVSMRIPQGLTGVSNTHPVSVELHPDGTKTVTFAPTPPMSSYLLYVGAGQFESVVAQHGETTVRVYTIPGQSRNAHHALDRSVENLRFFEGYFALPFPLRKLDSLAVPDFSFGAMENWGAVTYRQDRLLTNTETASLDDVLNVDITVDHEQAHQWFGDLVTMGDWPGLWLNESFADFMSYYSATKLHPELDPMAQWLGGRVAGVFTL
ncbi:MAG: M1 family metallopeptidase, partial [Nanoarchaeota archaeon]|nr:M1 family metallopeptidase [Nanoarchaeota archaeon]